jgi:hypothetical protein
MYARNTAGSPRRPDRPSRCRSAAMLGGGPICAMLATEPMSMPISRVVVATAVAGRPGFLKAASTSSRKSFPRLP